jgi:heptosyltransferase-2
MIRYYNMIARFMGCHDCPDLPELHTSSEDEAAVDQLLQKSGNKNKPYIVLNVGASYGPAKCWLPERFAQVADQLAKQHNVGVFITPGPKETAIAHKVADAMQEPVTITDDPIMPLSAIKALIRRSELLITNDTGPRHFAVALDTPVVTIFGSSDPRWTANNYEKERPVMVDLDCQPCMKRTCPLDHHNCMKNITTDMVLEKANELLGAEQASTANNS